MQVSKTVVEKLEKTHVDRLTRDGDVQLLRVCAVNPPSAWPCPSALYTSERAVHHIEGLSHTSVRLALTILDGQEQVTVRGCLTSGLSIHSRKISTYIFIREGWSHFFPYLSEPCPSRHAINTALR